MGLTTHTTQTIENALSSRAALGELLRTTHWVWALGIGQDVVVGQGVTNRRVCQGPGRFLQVDLVATVAPTGSDLIIDILKSSDGGATFTSLWNSDAQRPRIKDGQVLGSSITAFNLVAYEPRDILRLDVLQVGSATPGRAVTVELC
jgi:hypothetical protein